MQTLYKVEKDAAEDRELREKLRRDVSTPVVDALFAFLDQVFAESRLPDSSLLMIAVKYARDRVDGLRVFLNDASVPIDNNHTERQIRPVAIGRKNWMFHSTEYGARYSAILYSLISSCRLQGIDPMVYLVDVLQRIQTHPADETDLLIPRKWKEHFAADPMGSVASRLTLTSL